MKLNKISRLKLKKKSSKDEQKKYTRITNDTVAEHREKIIRDGKKFRYPMQYVKKKKVINGFLIAFGSLIVLVFVGWFAFYKVADTSDVSLQISKTFRLPIGKIDGETILYSDYLLKYRSSVQIMMYVNAESMQGENGNLQRDLFKREAFSVAAKDAYARKIAKTRNIQVSQDEVKAEIEKQRKLQDSTMSETAYNLSVEKALGWTPEENRYQNEIALLVQKVKYDIDDAAKNEASKLEKIVNNDKEIDLKKLFEQIKLPDEYKPTYIESTGLVEKNNNDGGLAEKAFNQEVNKVSGPITTLDNGPRGNGESNIFFIKTLEKKDNKVAYSYISIPLKKFDSDFNKVKKDNLEVYITLPEEKK